MDRNVKSMEGSECQISKDQNVKKNVSKDQNVNKYRRIRMSNIEGPECQKVSKDQNVKISHEDQNV